ncbi:PREDICTED: uncharacterized protein C10orf95-like [Bison bison bison]|uniref:Uncharacterized protein C10orf95-like n=1 Tax=Bison bison bison TaxID=43346 RepID=A0A6P3IEN5_BISBB|nr:PREDICTED: uncharacterized protein C10orf95-like [Bison bison bison]
MMFEVLRLAYHTDTAICPRRELGQPRGAGKRGAGSFRAAARLCPWRQVRRGCRACPETPPPGHAPRSRPDRRVPTIGAGLRRCSRPPGPTQRPRQSAERKRPRPPRARPYPAAPPPAAPAADRRAPPRGSHGCCYCSSGRGRCRRSSTRRPHRPHPSRYRRKTSSAAVERTRLRTTLRARAHGPAATRFTAAA